MPWLELQRPAKVSGRKREPGYRFIFPRYAAQKVVASGLACWVQGPHEDKREPTLVEKPCGALEATGEPEEALPSTGEFAALGKDEQKKLIRALRLDNECDLRKPESMAIVYAAWLGDQEE